MAGRAASAGERRAGRDLAGFRVRFAVWDGRGIDSDGQPHENRYAWIMKLAGGSAFHDSISFNDLWTRVQPR